MRKISLIEISRAVSTASPSLAFMLGAISAYCLSNAYENSVDRQQWLMIGSFLILALICAII